ncbi:hypothetical protein L207DRAFT_529559 [Hyaloscypha variabilis F]|uniref:Uncharacterized protein n=1 Tax=Hyaloscypha variabilis (strain UAMH 11265 / GT02V1 / F) TaxID=1149755 RepID=A0A2J6RM44_HYAVF|nr:hypothetical protein L207DRAFT_529559 [Hyaloscypha variabilis F]
MAVHFDMHGKIGTRKGKKYGFLYFSDPESDCTKLVLGHIIGEVLEKFEVPFVCGYGPLDLANLQQNIFAQENAEPTNLHSTASFAIWISYVPGVVQLENDWPICLAIVALSSEVARGRDFGLKISVYGILQFQIYFKEF